MEMGARVYTVERHRKLFLNTQNLLADLGYKAKCFYGDGYKGLPSYAPFDRILITAAAPEIPDDLIAQLKQGGKLVVPVGGAFTQKMILIEKSEKGELAKSTHGNFVFVPMLPGTSNGTASKQ